MRIRYAVPFLAVAGVHSAHASVVVVGSCIAGATSLPTIGQAITAAGANATIKICPGTYAEQLTITKNLTLVGVTSAGAAQVLIVPPAAGLANNAPDLDTGQATAAQIAVQGATVSISNITLDGSGNGAGAYGCAWDVVGIAYQNASGTISDTLIRNEYLAPFASLGGCQSGQGIFVQTSAGKTSTVKVLRNTIETYQKNGITGNDTGTNLTVTGNTVLGLGPTTGAAENSVQIAYGATGSVSANIVGGDIWQPDTFGDTGNAAAGILAYASAGVVITGNTINSTQYAIAVAGDGNGDGDGAQITNNKIGVTYLYDAIDVCGAGNATITGNAANASDESAIHLDSSCGTASTGNTVSGNKINGACAAILQGAGSGGTIGTNTVVNATSVTLTGSDVCGSGTQTSGAAAKQPAGMHFRPIR
jgi:parallel beta-helix repeat protein